MIFRYKKEGGKLNTYPNSGSPFRTVPSVLQTMSVLAFPENWAIHPILPRKKQALMKKRMRAG